MGVTVEAIAYLEDAQALAPDDPDVAVELARAKFFVDPKAADALAEQVRAAHPGHLEALLVAQLDAAEVEHAVLHRCQNPLSTTGFFPLEQGGDDTERQMQAGSGIADLGAGYNWHTVAKTGGGSGTAGATRPSSVRASGSSCLPRSGPGLMRS